MSKKTSRQSAQPVSEHAATDFDLRSRLDGPVEQLNRLQRSLLFAEISMVSYLDVGEATAAANTIGFSDTAFLQSNGAQAYVFDTATDRVVACRGTEPNEWNDIKADANAFTDLAETIGRVHRGFKREVDDLWPQLEERLVDETRALWFTGHSLGGAMATICASRCSHSEIPINAREVYTFGSPRPGTAKYIKHAGITHVRWVNNNDIVTRVPPTWLRYGHTGTRMYLDSKGNFRRMTARQRARDRSAGFWDGLKQRKFDHFSDHGIANYVAHIAKSVGA